MSNTHQKALKFSIVFFFISCCLSQNADLNHYHKSSKLKRNLQLQMSVLECLV